MRLAYAGFGRDIYQHMLNILVRLAVMGSVIVLALNVVRTWFHALRSPRKAIIAAPEDRIAFRAGEMVEQAVHRVTSMEMAVAQLNDAQVWTALEGFAEAVRRLTAAVMAEPAYYKRAKRHLGQILFAAEQAVRHFARHYSAMQDPSMRQRFLDLASELEAEFDRAAMRYAEAGAADLEVETEVLRDLLKRHRL